MVNYTVRYYRDRKEYQEKSSVDRIVAITNKPLPRQGDYFNDINGETWKVENVVFMTDDEVEITRKHKVFGFPAGYTTDVYGIVVEAVITHEI